MSEQLSTNPVVISTKRKKRVSTPRGPRTVDPGIAAIHAETKKQVTEYRRAKASQAVLDSIRAKFPKLTSGHLCTLGGDITAFLAALDAAHPTASNSTPEGA